MLYVFPDVVHFFCRIHDDRDWGWRGAGGSFGLGTYRQHWRQDHVVVKTPEYCSTKLCCCCHEPVRFMRRRVKITDSDGVTVTKFKTVRGAVQCPNPFCDLYGRAINRDVNAGALILDHLFCFFPRCGLSFVCYC